MMTCPFCDKSYDPEKSLVVCQEHDYLLDKWLVTVCSLCGLPAMSEYREICMPCIYEVENQDDEPVERGREYHSSAVRERHYLEVIGQN